MAGPALPSGTPLNPSHHTPRTLPDGGPERRRLTGHQAPGHVPDDGQAADEKADGPVRPERSHDRYPDRHQGQGRRTGPWPRRAVGRKRAAAGGPIMRLNTSRAPTTGSAIVVTAPTARRNNSSRRPGPMP